MAEAQPLARPRLTLPPVEAEALRTAYAEVGVVLEYGSGGSTVVAGDCPGLTVFSVESDADWLAMMADWFAANPARATVHLHHADIGPTRSWGRPLDDSHAPQWQDYPFSVWDRPDFLHPDVVLIDGRFRVGCFIATAFSITRPVTVLFDDYQDRKAYHAVERILQPVGMVGRMALFEMAPGLAPYLAEPWMIESFARPE